MKKFILLLTASLMISGSSFGQSSDSTNVKRPFYCTIMGYNTWGLGKVKITIDMGKYKNTEGYDNIYDSDGKKMKFNTMMEALNYMAQRGWRCIGTHALSSGSQNVIHYLLEKMVSSDEEAERGLLLRENKPKRQDEIYW